MTDESATIGRSSPPNTSRRSLLRTVGTAGTVAVLGAGVVTGRTGPGGNPQADCDCPDGMAKYEFEDCGFVHEAGGDWITFTDWKSKSGEDCEPIEVEYTLEPSLDEVTKVCAFGGRDNAEDTDPDGTFDEPLTNPGGQRAAISNITFCVDTGFQVDLIYGDPIEDLRPDNRYNQNPDRLLQALWSTPEGGTRLEDDHFHPSEDAYSVCGSEIDIVQDITYIQNTGQATATLDPGECDCKDFALVAYETAGHEFSFNQRFHDADTSGTESGGDCVYTVDVPD